jgi:hypothetical protein
LTLKLSKIIIENRMKKILTTGFFFFVFIFSLRKPAWAVCEIKLYSESDPFQSSDTQVLFKITGFEEPPEIPGLPDPQYRLEIYCSDKYHARCTDYAPNQRFQCTFEKQFEPCVFEEGSDREIKLFRLTDSKEVCSGTYDVASPTCNFIINPDPCLTYQPIAVGATDVDIADRQYAELSIHLPPTCENKGNCDFYTEIPIEVSGKYFVQDIGDLKKIGTYGIKVFKVDRIFGREYNRDLVCETTIDVAEGTPPGTYSACAPGDTACMDCIDQGKTWTALGCFSPEPAEFATFILQLALGIGSGISFLIMVTGAFSILTSRGDPEKINAGKDKITSAIAGILLIVFAVVILRIIGLDILKIPGFES